MTVAPNPAPAVVCEAPSPPAAAPIPEATLEALNYSKDRSLAGIAEVDEIFLLESFKGQRTLPRPARKRGGVAAKPGLSAEQIPVLIARNRAGNHIDAVLPDRSEAAVRPVLEGKLSKKDTLLCMDGDKALIAFAEAEGIEYELIIASKGEHVHETVLHIQNVNAYGGRFRHHHRRRSLCPRSRHLRWCFAVPDYAGDMRIPRQECPLAFFPVLVTLVHAYEPALRTGNMIQYPLDNVRQDPKCGHA